MGVSWAGLCHPRYKSNLQSGRLVLTAIHTKENNPTHPPAASTPATSVGRVVGVNSEAS